MFFLYEVKFAPFAPASCKERLPCGGSSRVRKSIVHSASFQSRGQDLFGEGLWQGQILPVLVSLQKLLGTSTKKALFGHDRVTAVFSLLKCSAIETFRSCLDAGRRWASGSLAWDMLQCVRVGDDSSEVLAVVAVNVHSVIGSLASLTRAKVTCGI